jgi:uncharacterized protein YcnI
MKSEFARAAAIAALWSLVAASTATARITLETAEAPADSYDKAAFRVPHGCKGTPTVAIRIRIPDGVTNVKPQQKAGWLEALRSPGSFAPIGSRRDPIIAPTALTSSNGDGTLAIAG